MDSAVDAKAQQKNRLWAYLIGDTIMPWWYAVAWFLWAWWRWNASAPVSVDVPETLHFGQWLVKHGRFPVHIHWVWGAPHMHWLAVGWEAGSAILFAVFGQGGGFGFFALWMGSLSLTLVLTILAIRRAGLQPSWGMVFLMGAVLSLYEPLVAAMWVLPGVAFLLWDSSALRHSPKRGCMDGVYAAVIGSWAWLSPSVLIAPIFTGALWAFWSRGHRRPVGRLAWRLFGAPVVAWLSLPSPWSWAQAVGRYLAGAVKPGVPWPGVTGLLHPYPITAYPSAIWLGLVGLVIIRGVWTRTPPKIWWLLLLPIAALYWKEAYFAPLAYWALATLLSFMGPWTLKARGAQAGLRIVVLLYVLMVGIEAYRVPTHLAYASMFPRYSWYQSESLRLPPGHIWMPLAQAGLFTLATGRPGWLDNRMQIWDAYPRFYRNAALIATGRVPLKEWLLQHHVVAVFWPKNRAVDRRLRSADWHITGYGPGHYRIWRPSHRRATSF